MKIDYCHNVESAEIFCYIFLTKFRENNVFTKKLLKSRFHVIYFKRYRLQTCLGSLVIHRLRKSDRRFAVRFTVWVVPSRFCGRLQRWHGTHTIPKIGEPVIPWNHWFQNHMSSLSKIWEPVILWNQWFSGITWSPLQMRRLIHSSMKKSDFFQFCN